MYDLVSRNYIRANGASLASREVLDLSDRRLGDESAAAIGDLLGAPNPQVRELIVRGNLIGDAGASKIAAALAATATVTRLDLSANKLTAGGLQHIIEALEPSGVTRLALSDNPVLSDAANTAVAGLAKSSLIKRVTSLDLANTSLTGAGLCALCAALRPSECIASLSLQRNPQAFSSSEAAEAVGELIRGSRTLAQLSLAQTGLTAAAAAKIAAGLRFAPALARLDLSGNAGLGDSGAAELAAALEGNATLRTLRLVACGIGAPGAAALERMLDVNFALGALELAGNPVDSADAARRVEAAVRRNAECYEARRSEGVPVDALATLKAMGPEGVALWAKSLGVGISAEAAQAFVRERVDGKALLAFSDAAALAAALRIPAGDAAKLWRELAAIAETFSFADSPAARRPSCADAFAELRAGAIAQGTPVAEAALDAYYAEVAAHVPPSVERLTQDEALAVALVVRSVADKDAFAVRLNEALVAARKEPLPGKMAALRGFLALVLAAMEKLPAPQNPPVITFAADAECASNAALGNILSFGKFVVSGGSEVAAATEDTKAATFRAVAPLARDVSAFSVAQDDSEKVFLLSPNASFVVVAKPAENAPVELVEVTSNRLRW